MTETIQMVIGECRYDITTAIVSPSQQITAGQSPAQQIETRVGVNGELLFYCTRIPDQAYSIVEWPVEGTKTQRHYLQELVTFHREVSKGGYASIENRGLPAGIYGKKIGEKLLDLCALDGNLDEVVNLPVLRKSRLLSVYTPFLAFAMADFYGPKDRWSSVTGRLSVTSVHNVAKPLATLVERTARIKAPADDLALLIEEAGWPAQ